MARFEHTHDPIALLAVAAQVLRAARPHEPDLVSQREYNDARVRLGHGSTPRADKLVARFGVSWMVFRDRALNADHPPRALAMAAMRQVRRVLTTAEAVSAVQRAASYLGSEEISVTQYTEARRALMMRASARHTHARHLMPMPEAHSIGTKFGFAKIVAAAGLRMPPNREPPLMSRADAICVFIEVYGFMPRKDDLTWMGRAHGIQLMSADKYLHSVEAKTALERFASRGRWCPPISTRGLVRPEQWEDIEDTSGILAGLAIKYPRKRAADQGHTLEEVRSAIALAWDALPKGQSLTVERYASVRRTQGLPHYGTAHKIAQRNGTTFAQLVRDEADARSRRDGRTKSD